MPSRNVPEEELPCPLAFGGDWDLEEGASERTQREGDHRVLAAVHEDQSLREEAYLGLQEAPFAEVALGPLAPEAQADRRILQDHQDHQGREAWVHQAALVLRGQIQAVHGDQGVEDLVRSSEVVVHH